MISLLRKKTARKFRLQFRSRIHFGSPAVREREILGLMEALEEYGLEEGLILTMDDEEVLKIEGKDGKKRIIVKSVWKWMLE